MMDLPPVGIRETGLERIMEIADGILNGFPLGGNPVFQIMDDEPVALFVNLNIQYDVHSFT